MFEMLLGVIAAEKGNTGTCYLPNDMSAKDFLTAFRYNRLSADQKSFRFGSRKEPRNQSILVWAVERKAPIDTCGFTAYPNAKYSHSRADNDLQYNL